MQRLASLPPTLPPFPLACLPPSLPPSLHPLEQLQQAQAKLQSAEHFMMQSEITAKRFQRAETQSEHLAERLAEAVMRQMGMPRVREQDSGA